MKLGHALVLIAFGAFAPSVPAAAAKDAKLPRCNGHQKRPANLYGTILPSIPARGQASAAAAPKTGPATNLFPGEDTTVRPQKERTPERVPAIGTLVPSSGPTAARSTSFASC